MRFRLDKFNSISINMTINLFTSCSPKTSIALEASLRSFSVNGSGSPVIPTVNTKHCFTELR
jgi:hypothetical protein